MTDLVERQAVLDAIHLFFTEEIDKIPTKKTEDGEVYAIHKCQPLFEMNKALCKRIKELPSVNPQEPKMGQYEKHIDHTDCLWYGSGDCPVTCSQYRDGWNDAMDYIFKNGKGYQPYRHDV